jgi:putative FmdB family regulatory protein
MPMYQYKCNDCETIFERHQRMIEPPIRDCPECQGSVRRLINNVGIVFKGSGFYVTDNRNGNGRVKSANGAATTDTKSETTGEKSGGNSDSTSSTSGETSTTKTESPAAAVPASSAT